MKASAGNVIGEYRNGNADITLFGDGTKMRVVHGGSYSPAFPESIDLKITNRCVMGCDMCHEGSVPMGRHARLMGAPLLEGIHEFQELAIGGGDIFTHPELVPFLDYVGKQKGAIPSITLHAGRLEEHDSLIRYLQKEKLVYGIGISVISPDCIPESVFGFPNAVLHVINGIFDPDIFRQTADRGAKLLILGYKKVRRGETFYSNLMPVLDRNREWLESMLASGELARHYEAVAFDNLAIEQLHVRRYVPEKVWEQCYMGNDATHSFYIDMVNQEYAAGSSVLPEQRFKYTEQDTVDGMFRHVRHLQEVESQVSWCQNTD